MSFFSHSTISRIIRHAFRRPPRTFISQHTIIHPLNISHDVTFFSCALNYAKTHFIICSGIIHLMNIKSRVNFSCNLASDSFHSSIIHGEQLKLSSIYLFRRELYLTNFFIFSSSFVSCGANISPKIDVTLKVIFDAFFIAFLNLRYVKFIVQT